MLLRVSKGEEVTKMNQNHNISLIQAPYKPILLQKLFGNRNVIISKIYGKISTSILSILE